MTTMLMTLMLAATLPTAAAASSTPIDCRHASTAPVFYFFPLTAVPAPPRPVTAVIAGGCVSSARLVLVVVLLTMMMDVAVVVVFFRFRRRVTTTSQHPRHHRVLLTTPTGTGGGALLSVYEEADEAEHAHDEGYHERSDVLARQHDDVKDRAKISGICG